MWSLCRSPETVDFPVRGVGDTWVVALEVRGTGMGVNREQISGGDSYRGCAQRVGRVRDGRLVVGVRRGVVGRTGR